MPPAQDDTTLTDLRIAVARLEARFDSHASVINSKLDQAMVSRAHLEERLAPITESMNKWRGALTMITLLAGAAGASVSIFVKHIFASGSSP